VTARFRLIDFLADPFTGARFPIAALVQVGREVSVARAPQAIELGLGYSTGAYTTARFIVDSLEASATSIDALPVSVGPHAVLGEERLVPEGVTAPVSWIEDTLLRPSTPSILRAAAKERVRERTGFRFLQQWNVAQFVGHPYRARSHFPKNKFGLILQDVSQFVRGPSHLLLMEPLVIDAGSYKRSLKHVGTVFAAWQHAFDSTRDPQRAELVAYVLSGDRPDAVAHAKEALRGSADRVVDVNASTERAAFFDSIRSTAALN
jgi:hypothetical protein